MIWTIVKLNIFHEESSLLNLYNNAKGFANLYGAKQKTVFLVSVVSLQKNKTCQTIEPKSIFHLALKHLHSKCDPLSFFCLRNVDEFDLLKILINSTLFQL